MTLRGRWLVLVAALPALWYLLYLVIPFVASLRMSANTFSRSTGIQQAISAVNYALVVQDPAYLRAWITTLRVAAEASVLTVGLGTVVAYGMWRVGGRWRAYLSALVLAPLLVSGVARAYGWIAIGGPNGPWAHATEALGLGPIPILFNEASVIMSFVHVFLALVVIQVLIRLDAIPLSVTRAAANLGAGQVSVARRLILPLITPALTSSLLVVFALSTAAYSVPTILGGGRVLTVAQVIYREHAVNFNWPLASALATLLTAVTIVIMLAYQSLARGSERRATAMVEP